MLLARETGVCILEYDLHGVSPMTRSTMLDICLHTLPR